MTIIHLFHKSCLTAYYVPSLGLGQSKWMGSELSLETRWGLPGVQLSHSPSLLVTSPGKLQEGTSTPRKNLRLSTLVAESPKVKDHHLASLPITITWLQTRQFGGLRYTATNLQEHGYVRLTSCPPRPPLLPGYFLLPEIPQRGRAGLKKSTGRLPGRS